MKTALLIVALLAASAGDPLAVTFRDLIEIKFVQSFRSLGVSWKVIRLAAEKARKLVRDDHPFTTEKFFTDGRNIFAELPHEGHRDKHLLDLISDQYCFRDAMLPVNSAGMTGGCSVIESLYG